ncbi:glycosyltransferase [Methylomonas sp. HW2-6]|uniref:glycosyltransferase n=1 Tax=Methylomonas sp. HW2-6 TaxID=3376687 RepID=UPI0040436DA9
MKILRVIRTVNPESGGPVEALKQSSLVIKDMGHEIDVLSLDGDQADYITQLPLKVYAVGPGSGNYGYAKGLSLWLEQNYHRYDAVIVEGLWQYHGFAVRNILTNKNVPYFVFTHGMLDPWFKRRYPLKHLKKWLYWPWAEYLVLRDAEKVLFTCQEEKILARQSFWLYRCNEQVVNFGTLGHQGSADEQRQLFLNQFPSLAGKRFLLFLSRIHPKKGIDLLIEAFAQVCGSDSELELVIAGPDQVGWGIELNSLAEKLDITHKITWTGMLSGDLKWGAYLSAEAFILPSHQENFGIVVAEAMSCRLPVLISNKVNIWHEIKQDQAGLVVDDTLPGCVKLISDWQSLDNDAKSSMRENAFRCFIERFEITKAANSLLDAVTVNSAADLSS